MINLCVCCVSLFSLFTFVYYPYWQWVFVKTFFFLLFIQKKTTTYTNKEWKHKLKKIIYSMIGANVLKTIIFSSWIYTCISFSFFFSSMNRIVEAKRCNCFCLISLSTVFLFLSRLFNSNETTCCEKESLYTFILYIHIMSIDMYIVINDKMPVKTIEYIPNDQIMIVITCFFQFIVGMSYHFYAICSAFHWSFFLYVRTTTMMAISQIIPLRWHPGIDCSVLSFSSTWSLNIAGGR